MFLINLRLYKCEMKDVVTYLYALEFVPECYETPKKCDKAVDT